MDFRLSQRTLVNIFLALATVAAVSGAIALLVWPDSNPRVEIVLPTPTPTPQLKVYIRGAVKFPDVYTLDAGARLKDAVDAAGGLLPEADASAINLAERLKDEDHFHIPTMGIALPLASKDEHLVDTRIDINTAPVSLLITLDGIGGALAQRIVQHRETYGPFKVTAEIMKVRGIGIDTYEKIRDSIRVSLGSP